jgi:hypothetical protein
MESFGNVKWVRIEVKSDTQTVGKVESQQQARGRGLVVTRKIETNTPSTNFCNIIKEC